MAGVPLFPWILVWAVRGVLVLSVPLLPRVLGVPIGPLLAVVHVGAVGWVLVGVWRVVVVLAVSGVRGACLVAGTVGVGRWASHVGGGEDWRGFFGGGGCLGVGGGEQIWQSTFGGRHEVWAVVCGWLEVAMDCL